MIGSYDMWLVTIRTILLIKYLSKFAKIRTCQKMAAEILVCIFLIFYTHMHSKEHFRVVLYIYNWKLSYITEWHTTWSYNKIDIAHILPWLTFYLILQQGLGGGRFLSKRREVTEEKVVTVWEMSCLVDTSRVTAACVGEKDGKQGPLWVWEPWCQEERDKKTDRRLLYFLYQAHFLWGWSRLCFHY